MTTRTDSRYVQSDDTRAVLRAWGGDDLTMDMGGWTDGDEDAFFAAVQDESRRSGGEPLERVRIERRTDEGWEKVCDSQTAKDARRAGHVRTGRPPESPNGARDEMLRIRVTKREQEAFGKAAGEQGISAWARGLMRRAAGLDVVPGDRKGRGPDDDCGGCGGDAKGGR